MESDQKTVVFYDGDCGFCNRSVQFILANDRKNLVYFSPLQGTYFQGLFAAKGEQAPDLNAMYLLENGQLYSKSTAALRLVKYFPWYQKWLWILWIVPKFIRDFVYDFIAKRRKRIMNGFCMLPTEEQQLRFIK